MPFLLQDFVRWAHSSEMTPCTPQTSQHLSKYVKNNKKYVKNNKKYTTKPKQCFMAGRAWELKSEVLLLCEFEYKSLLAIRVKGPHPALTARKAVFRVRGFTI